ncbi:MAG: helix-turn-helix domain-containing protein, partial [Muribaculaceae bacterium]
GEIKDMQVELTKARYRERMSLYGMAGATLIIILSALFLVILYNHNRRLNESNRSLYRKNEELLRQEISQAKPTDSVDIVKYSGSNIADEYKVEILNRTKELLRSSEEVYADDFCIARLATMVDVKEKVLSQVINELWGGNFVSLINHYRINEACRRITDINNFGNFTIESIGNSVGFKSRSAFIAAFKKQTGLTPSEYKKQANDIV